LGLGLAISKKYLKGGKYVKVKKEMAHFILFIYIERE
jgi:hypothetical protein